MLVLWCSIRGWQFQTSLGWGEGQAMDGSRNLTLRGPVLQLYLGGWKHQLNPEDPYPACTLGIWYLQNWVSWVTARGVPRGRMSANLRISWRTASVWCLGPVPLAGPPLWPHYMVSLLLYEFSSIQKRVGKKEVLTMGRLVILGTQPYPQLPRLQAQDWINGSHLACSQTDTQSSLGGQW